MDRERLLKLLNEVASGGIAPEQALESLRELPVAELGYANLDTHRQLRLGFPEAVFGLFKTAEQIIGISRKLLEHHDRLLVTRVEPAKAAAVRAAVPALEYDETARLLFCKPAELKPTGAGAIAVVSAGTADLPVAREAALSAEIMGNRVVELHDVGVAGIHRLLGKKEIIAEAAVVIVVAGMEGALAGVVAGLTPAPVIAVPTSVGYGASFGGVAALLGMLNSCAPAVAVVNIDNGYGAAAVASAVNHLPARLTAET